VGSEGNSGIIAKGVATWRVHNMGPSAKWSDDVSSLRRPISGTGTPSDPFVYAYDRQKAIEITAPTGIPWHSEKGQDFGPIFTYVGLEWNIAASTVTLPEKKRPVSSGRRCARQVPRHFVATHDRLLTTFQLD
jgi:hypothetical protein